MIERIYIPTVKRVNYQITYNQLPVELQRRVIFVVQAWERDQYNYDAKYLVLPEHVNLTHPMPMSETRKLIYEDAQDVKYAIIDDDLVFYRRNSRYWSEISNMEKSNKICDENDILEMFDLFDGWLDEPNVTVASCWPKTRFPGNSLYANNKAVCGIFVINGPDFKHILHEFDLMSVKVGEDVLFIMYLLVNGYGNRTSNEFIFKNDSIGPLSNILNSEMWDDRTFESVYKDHKKLAELFPGFFKILYDKDGNRVSGGYRNYGKIKMYCSKAFKSSKKQNSLMNFFE